MDSFELILIVAFSALSLIAAIGFITFRQPVHAALSFAVTVLAGSGLYLLLDAPYAAVATVIVYAGATIIIFLFALMFAQRSTLQVYDEKKANPILSGIAAISLTTILIYVLSTASVGGKLLSDGSSPVPTADAVADPVVVATSAPRVADLGRVMYTQYLWAIELAGAILLVATLGAIHIARDDSQADAAVENALP